MSNYDVEAEETDVCDATDAGRRHSAPSYDNHRDCMHCSQDDHKRRASQSASDDDDDDHSDGFRVAGITSTIISLTASNQ